MGVAYNLKDFDFRLSKIEKAVSPQGISDSLTKIKALWLRRVRLQFVESKDPYGNVWTPGKKRTGRTLVHTSLLSRSFEGAVSGKRLTIGVGGPAAQYANAHQKGRPGGKKIVAAKGKAFRFVLPDGTIIFRKSFVQGALPKRILLPEDTLPPAWEADARKVLESSLEV